MWVKFTLSLSLSLSMTSVARPWFELLKACIQYMQVCLHVARGHKRLGCAVSSTAPATALPLHAPYLTTVITDPVLCTPEDICQAAPLCSKPIASSVAAWASLHPCSPCRQSLKCVSAFACRGGAVMSCCYERPGDTVGGHMNPTMRKVSAPLEHACPQTARWQSR